VRNIIGSPQYACLFDTQLAEDSQAGGKWHTRDGGMYYAVGIGGSIMGHGGDVALIDDPFENYGSRTIRTATQAGLGLVYRHTLQPAAAKRRHRHHQSQSARFGAASPTYLCERLAQQKPCFFLPPAPRNRSRISGWRDIHANLNIWF
jgi:hypothetical protein